MIPEDWAQYTDKFGLIQPDTTGRSSDNGIRFTAEAIESSANFFELEAFECFAFCISLFQNILKCERKDNPGILERYPGCKTQEGFDDYIAACAVSFFCDGGQLARRIYQHGVKNYGFYCNDGFSWNSFLWRNPSFVSFSKFCAIGSINLWDVFILCSSLFIAANSNKQDSKILSWFIIRCLKQRSKIIDKIIKYWERKLREQYPLGIGEVLGKYYDPAHFDHPNSKALMGVYD